MKQFLKRLVSEHCIAVALLLATLLAIVATVERRRIFGKMSPADFSLPPVSERKQGKNVEAESPPNDSKKLKP